MKDEQLGGTSKGKKKNGNYEFDKGISLNVQGEIRGIETVDYKGNKYIIFTKYGDKVECFEVLY